MTILGAEQSVFRLFQVNNDDVRSITGLPPTKLRWRCGLFCRYGEQQFVSIYANLLCVCVCVLAASRLRAECQVAPLHGAAPFGGENEQCCSAPPQDFCSTTGGKHRGDVGKVGGEEHAARCEPHFSCRCPRSGGTAVCVPTRI